MERSQHDLALNLAVTRVRATLGIVLVLAVGVELSSPGAALSQVLIGPTQVIEPTGLEVAESLIPNVVRIEARMKDGTENGFGFIVGERDGTLYVVTANHVVSDPQAVGEESRVEVSIEFSGHQGETYKAKLLGTHDVAHDLAVLTVPAPRRYDWDPMCLGNAEEQIRPTPVWFIGRDQKWFVPVTPGHVTSEEPVDEQIEVDGLAIRPGSSGGPLIGASGILGMVQVDSAGNAKALSIFYIQKAFRRWNHPWELQSWDVVP